MTTCLNCPKPALVTYDHGISCPYNYCEECLLIRKVETRLLSRFLRFRGGERGTEFRVAAIFVDPRDGRPGRLGGKMEGRIGPANAVRFLMLDAIRFQGSVYYKVEVVQGHIDGATVGWLPSRQIMFEEDVA